MVATAGRFFIKHNHAGQFSYLTLDVPGGSAADGVRIQQFTFHGGTNQQWQLADVGNGFFTIVSLATGRALDIPGGVPTALVAVQQFRLHGGPNQQWRFVTTPAVTGPSLFRPEIHQIINRATGMALDVPNGSQASDITIQQSPPNTGWNQTWILEPVPTSSVPEELRFIPSAVNFGTVPVGGTVSRMLTIDNRTGDRVSVTVQRPPSGAFHWDGFSAVLADRDQRGVTVEFSPQTAGDAQVVLRATSDLADSPHLIRVRGRGTEDRLPD